MITSSVTRCARTSRVEYKATITEEKLITCKHKFKASPLLFTTNQLRIVNFTSQRREMSQRPILKRKNPEFGRSICGDSSLGNVTKCDMQNRQ